MKTVFILGRQPDIGIAELESLCGANKLELTNKFAVVANINPKAVSINRLGGTMKLAKLLAFLPSTDWKKIEDYLVSSLPEQVDNIPEGKIRLGLSLYGIGIDSRRINYTGLILKKAIKAQGRSVRVVPNKSKDLNTAQVIHNQLAGPTGLELLLIADGNRTIVAQTVAVQDIDAYAARDQRRPMRDAKVGMLPPKLAQTIINLTVGGTDTGKGTVLDPFCGTGVILQEALLMGFDIIGTDIDQRMVDYSRHNINQWLIPNWGLDKIATIETGDATNANWKPLPNFIACETYLGRPFSNEPKPEILRQIIQDVDTIHYKFLQNVARQTKPGFRLCIAVPSWKTRSGFKHLKTLDSLEKLGYTRLSFTHVDNSELIYHRPDQIVGRELLVLTRK